ncbi:uncharacterized protein LOC109716858 [Ananas comosus]|uniref:Uncharacterized protein LOC109716858 n=1 Tax=Ananas comosus TaxID=4615 RepID=A0A6P5FP19_ANACO|nr:uncharacterized protein LOC109716858 [Ananas comosus]
MANNNNNSAENTRSRPAIWSAEMLNSAPTYASGGGPPRHVAPEYGTTERYYGDKSNSSAIPTTVGRGTVAAPDARYHVAWEDRSTGSYYRYNTGVQQDRGGEGYRWYENVKVRDAGSGFQAKYTAEEKYQRVPHDDDDDADVNDDHAIDHDQGHEHDHHDVYYDYGDADAVADYDHHDGDEW